MRWAGFRKVRGQVCKRIQRRMRALGITESGDYHAYIEAHNSEWIVLDSLCRVTISRFYRDRHVYEVLVQQVLPTLALQLQTQGASALRIWSAGCSCGEEPYSLAIMWQLNFAKQFPDLALQILATDIDKAVLRRAEQACYSHGSLKDLPGNWIEASFERHDDLFCLQQAIRSCVTFREHDVRTSVSVGPFDLILCRNLAFTYFDPEMQSMVLQHIYRGLKDKGVLVIGAHEHLPDEAGLFEPWLPNDGIYRKSVP